jgi:1-acyl-sn-glycerol-3-phosphate acyltransferase
VDVWILVAMLPGSIRFIAKRELLRVPLIGSAIRATGQIPVNRHDRDAAERSYSEAAEVLRRGRSVIVFVEGTRSADGRLGEFKKGGFVLATRSSPRGSVTTIGTRCSRARARGSWRRRSELTPP